MQRIVEAELIETTVIHRPHTFYYSLEELLEAARCGFARQTYARCERDPDLTRISLGIEPRSLKKLLEDPKTLTAVKGPVIWSSNAEPDLTLHNMSKSLQVAVLSDIVLVHPEWNNCQIAGFLEIGEHTVRRLKKYAECSSLK